MGSIKTIASELTAVKNQVEDEKYPESETSIIKGLKLVDKSLLVCNLAKNVHYVKSIKLRPDDCFITGYPKSGINQILVIKSSTYC
jgi:hypothetical protein